jgi:hypothetical protein
MNALRVRLPLLCPRTSGPSSVFAPTQTCRYTTVNPSTHRFRTPQATHTVQSVNKRTMTSSGSSSAPLQEWLVIAPDFEGALEKRLKVRNEHLEGLKKDPEDFWLWGGMYTFYQLVFLHLVLHLVLHLHLHQLLHPRCYIPSSSVRRVIC